jgi:hypothetical protein
METTDITKDEPTRAPTPTPVRPIRLHLAGDGLMLAGRFDHWMPVALMTASTDQPGVVQILFDATATARPRATAKRPDLFSFTSRKIRRVGDSSFAARGTLRLGSSSEKVEAVVQSPQGHTPFFFVTFPLDQEKHAALWSTLGDLAANSGGAEKEMRPQGWMQAPQLAVA